MCSVWTLTRHVPDLPGAEARELSCTDVVGAGITAQPDPGNRRSRRVGYVSNWRGRVCLRERGAGRFLAARL